LAYSLSRIARVAGIAVLFVVAAMLGIVTGVLFAYAGGLPQVSALDDYTPSTITRVFAGDGRVVGEFATERRVVIGYDDIAPRLRQAIIAAEDSDFEEHVGLSVTGIIRAFRDILYEQRYGSGGSTLTQQLARKLFLTPIKGPERKIKEWILAIQIERHYTKREILTLYCNQMYLGSGAYGVEAASRLYFNKSAKDLNLDEAAMIAGIFQLPERQSPLINMKAALQRRNYTLQRMAAERYITQAEADAARARPIVLSDRARPANSLAPYFIEEIRKYIERKYGARQLYENGLSIQSTLDYDLQTAANVAVDRGVRSVDHRHRAFRPPKRNVIDEGLSPNQFRHRRWERPIRVDDVVAAVVVAVSGIRAAEPVVPALAPGAARVRVGPYLADLLPAGFSWTKQTLASQLLKPGDVIDVRIAELNEAARTATVLLEQEPAVEGALVAIDNRTGQIRAMVGGMNFERSKFNRAVQAYRQLGSTFKPIVYTAAIDRGFTPTSILLDAPVSYSAGAGQPPYQPKNYDRKYEGTVTLRHVLETSRNVPTVRMVDHLGPRQIISYARKFGFEEKMEPYLSIALGSTEATLLEVTSAYTVFPNHGIRVRPFDIVRISDREGNLLEQNRSEPRDSIRADTAFIMTNLLRGVVQRGTATKALELDWPVAGKTGTMDEYSDAWFIGFDPNLTVGVWVGNDDKKPLGNDETGAKAALPIWVEFMKAYIEKYGNRNSPPTFEPPGNIVFQAVDRSSGSALDEPAAGAITEAFIAGTQPGQGAFPKQ
jgi:penicillin-binding protein 1A